MRYLFLISYTVFSHFSYFTFIVSSYLIKTFILIFFDLNITHMHAYIHTHIQAYVHTHTCIHTDTHTHTGITEWSHPLFTLSKEDYSFG